MKDEASMVEILRPDAPGRVLLTAEHASEELPPGVHWPAADAWLKGTHWALDLGAAELTRELSEALNAPAVLARFSRLWIDANRPAGSDTLFREQAEGREIALNRELDAAERERRLSACYRPYHAAIDAALAASPADVVFAIHTFTPVYEGEARTLGVGVLFEHEQALATRVAEALSPLGVSVALNEPYSGRAGMIYAASYHAGRHGRRALELEVRQDLCVDADFRAKLVDLLDAELFRG
ncbi:MAG: N-formylglutamate amidohydrolase [Deltaproteobacteria bacterium]|nr:N-formylglutamate amidohydrolase [Deltaproteobacteria bacterium]